MEQDYSQFFSKLYTLSSSSFISFFLLTFFRIGPIVTLAPFLGAKIPAPAKIGLLIAISCVFFPHTVLTSKAPVLYDVLFIGYAFKELFIGFVLAFLINV